MSSVALADTTVTGANDPATDRAAVQAAVNAGGTVYLSGTFNFSGLGSGSPARVITITNSVDVVGLPVDGELPRIVGGVRPFFVGSTTAAVSFDGLRFEQTAPGMNASIYSVAADSLTVTRCRFEFVDSSAIVLQPTVPEQFGTVTIADNVLHGAVVATPLVPTAGFTLNVQGFSGRMVRNEMTISGNEVSGFSGQGINVNTSGCPTTIVGNRVTVGTRGRTGLPGAYVHAIRATALGDYTIEDNFVDCAHANAAGIRLGGTTGTLVKGNEVNMSVPEDVSDATLDLNMQSGGIVVEGSDSHSEIVHNHVSGRARVAISVVHSDFGAHRPAGTSGNPEYTSFRGNDATRFLPSFADADVGDGIADPGSPEDLRPVATVIAGPSGLVLNDEGECTVSIEWDPPEKIRVGTALSSAELDAVTNRPGDFEYSPPEGSFLKQGKNWLTLTFFPSEAECSALFPLGIEYSVPLIVRGGR